MPPDEPDADLAGLEQRRLYADDAPAVAALTHRCVDADGGLREVSIQRFLRGCQASGDFLTLGGYEGAELRACAVLSADPSGVECRGQVDPDWRGRGVGRNLLAWSLAAAGVEVVIATESLTASADRLYRRFGFRQVFAEEVMRRQMHGNPLSDAAIDGVQLIPWSDSNAGDFFRVYQGAFRERPGFPGWSLEQWTNWATGDDDFLPEPSLLAVEGETPIGFIACAKGWVVQMGVAPQARRRGVGRLLLIEALRRFDTHATPEVWLDVNVNNPGAARLYRELGFEVVGRRARYAK